MSEPYRMGELAAHDKYKPTDADIAHALALAGKGYGEGEARGLPQYPDAGAGQQPPPLPPFFNEDTPPWANQQQGTPQFRMEGDMVYDTEWGA